MPQDENTHKRRVDMLMNLIDMYYSASKAFDDGSGGVVEPVQRNRYGKGPQGMQASPGIASLVPSANPFKDYSTDPRGAAINSTMPPRGGQPEFNGSLGDRMDHVRKMQLLQELMRRR